MRKYKKNNKYISNLYKNIEKMKERSERRNVNEKKGCSEDRKWMRKKDVVRIGSG